MALISPESLERVKQTADIVEVISAHTDLRRARAPAGSASARSTRSARRRSRSTPQEKLYHCFGCGVGGDVIKFVEEKEGLGFAEAVELLADRYGVELEREQEDPRAEARRQQRRRLEQLLDRTAAFYANYLWESQEAAKAREYLAERGLRRGGAARVRRRLRAQRLGQDPRPRPAGGLQRRRAARGRPGPAGAGRGRVRPLPLADHVPDPRPPRPHARLRRPGDALRPGRQVREHGRDRLLPQEPDALRGRPGEGGDRQGDARGRGRGLHRRAGAAPGRGRGGGRR